MMVKSFGSFSLTVFEIRRRESSPPSRQARRNLPNDRMRDDGRDRRPS